MELRNVDPWKVTVSNLNERDAAEVDKDFVNNVKKMGLVQPPIVQTLNETETAAQMGAQYGAIVGGRRISAAQQADLDEIPVVVMDEWDNGSALAASIVENIDAFRKDVDPKDRALAIERLKKLEGLNNTEIAEKLGVTERTIRRWLEWVRDEWGGTSIDAHIDKTEEFGDVAEFEAISNSLSSGIVQNVRLLTGGGKKGEKVLKQIQKRGLNENDVREVKKRADRGQSIQQAVEQVADEKREKRLHTEARIGSVKVRTKITFTGDYASAIQQASKDRGASENQIARIAIEEWLKNKNYL